MTNVIYITKAKDIGNLCVLLTFNDGTERTIDVGEFIRSHPHPMYNRYLDPKLVYQSIGMIVTGKASFRDMTGIVGTVDFVSDTMAQTKSATAAVDLFLWFMALIAVNLGIVNLFPLPALDGGRLIFIIIEMIRRKPVPPEKEGVIHLVGMVLLLVLMVALTVSDIMRCFGG